CRCAVVEPRSKGPEQVGRNDGVRIDDDDRVGPTLGQDSLEGIGEGIAFSTPPLVLPNEHLRPGALRPGRGEVRAIVGADGHAEKLRWIVDGTKTFDRISDTGLLVVSRDDDFKAMVRESIGRWPQAARQQGQQKQVTGGTQRWDRRKAEQ